MDKILNNLENINIESKPDTKEIELLEFIAIIEELVSLDTIRKIDYLKNSQIPMPEPIQELPSNLNAVDYQFQSIINLHLLEFLKRNQTILSEYGCAQYQRVYPLLLKSKLSMEHFNRPYHDYVRHFTTQWNQAIKENNIRDFCSQLDKHKYFLQEYFSILYGKKSMTHQEVLEHRFGSALTKHYSSQIQSYRKNYQNFYGKLKKGEDFSSDSQFLSALSQSEIAEILENQIQYFKQIFADFTIEIVFAEHHLPSIHQSDKCSYTIFLPKRFTFAQQLHTLLGYLAHVFYPQYLEVQENEVPLWINDLSSQSSISFMEAVLINHFQLLPVLSKDYLHRLSQDILRVSQAETKPKLTQLQVELLTQFLSLQKNPLDSTLSNPIQRILTLSVEHNVEELWFNDEITSQELAYYFQEEFQTFVAKKPSHHMEGSLRMKNWITGDLGNAFAMMAGFLSIFSNGLIDSRTNHNYSIFFHHLQTNTLSDWKPTKLKTIAERTDCNHGQMGSVFFSQVFSKQYLNSFKK